MRRASTMGAAGLLKALTVALCVLGGQAAGGSRKSSKKGGLGPISQRVKDLVAKMVSYSSAVGRGDGSIRCALDGLMH